MARIKVVPSGDGEFLEWGDTFCAYLEDKADGWGIPKSAVTALEALRAEYRRTYAAAQNPNRGKADVCSSASTPPALYAGFSQETRSVGEAERLSTRPESVPAALAR